MTMQEWHDLVEKVFAQVDPYDHPNITVADVDGVLHTYFKVVGADQLSHVIELRGDGWTLQHPLTCRPNLFACPVNRAAEGQAHAQSGPGRYECWLDGDELIIGERIEEQP